jgi:phosphohistidine phosphatase SixA
MQPFDPVAYLYVAFCYLNASGGVPMRKTIRQCVVLLLLLLSSRSELLAAATSADLWTQLAAGGQAVLMRHAMAPGVGDPATFQLGDCSTQRNLSAAGRQQARRIGAAFRQHGVTVEKIYTSQWCRCQETAELLGLGDVEPLPLLNSFFQERQRGQEQTEALAQFLTTTRLSGVMILVTHQVNITALTGIYPASGEAVIVAGADAQPLRTLGKLAVAPE